MSNLVLNPPPVVTLAIEGSDQQFPVRRVYCIGRNYAAHAIEMGHDPNREPPFFFQKNPDNLYVGKSFPYPEQTKDVHHEIEMVVALKSGGRNIPVHQALDHVWGYGVGLDMTRRDLQGIAKEMGRPWEIGKAFDASAPIGPIHPASDVGHFEQAAIWLTVNGADKQRSDVTHLIWSVAETVADLSKYFRLEPGDLIYTGTPEGVGAVKPGDLMVAGVERLGELSVRVA